MNPESVLAANCHFDTFKDLETAIKALEELQNAVFIKKSSKKLPATKGSIESETLVYQFILYECKHGTERASKSKGLRPNQRSLKLGCPAKFKVKMVKVQDNWKLQVVQSDLVHANHMLSQESVKALPERRKVQLTPMLNTLLQYTVYQFILYECKHGTERASKSKGLRPNQRSLKLGCPAKFKVKMVKVQDNWKLQVVQSDLVHANHMLSQESVKALPERRKVQLTPMLNTLLQYTSVSNTELREVILKEQNVVVAPKDVSNLRAKKAQSKSRILTDERKFKLKNEHYKDDLQEDGIDDSQEKWGTDDNREEDATGDSRSKKDESSLFYGTHETQVSEGGEADLHKHLVSCKKNPGHIQFVPVNDFNIKHLPECHHDNDLVEYIKATADLTVRVDVTKTSRKRPKCWPKTKQPYAFSDKRGSDVMRLGTGMVWYVNNYNNKGTCRCHKCQHSDTPSKVWGEVWMHTATHVVFDDLEARHTTCRLFYDRQDSPLVTLDGWTVSRANIEEDRCGLECVTCDVDLLDKLDKMVRHWDVIWGKVHNKYKSSRVEVKLIFIVSHPHGCPKQVSVGHWIDRYKVSEHMTKYTYTTCTCPGSSGAYVHTLGYIGWLYYAHHVHSGVNSEGINFSAAGRDRP